MRKDGPGISGISHNTPGIKLLKEKINARFEPNTKAMFEFNNDNNADLKSKPANGEQNLIMSPSYIKEQNRIEKEIKRLEEQIKHEKNIGNNDKAEMLEAQKKMYQQQLNDVKSKIEEEKNKTAQTPSAGLATGDTRTEKERETAEMQKEALEAIQNEDARQKKAEYEPDPTYGLAE